MRILKADIVKFQQVYKDRFGIEIDESVALDKLNTLLNQVNLILDCLSPEHRVAMTLYGEKDNDERDKNEQSGTVGNF